NHAENEIADDAIKESDEFGHFSTPPTCARSRACYGHLPFLALRAEGEAGLHQDALYAGGSFLSQPQNFLRSKKLRCINIGPSVIEHHGAGQFRMVFLANPIHRVMPFGWGFKTSWDRNHGRGRPAPPCA